jgi:hypothetical protein
MCKQDKHLKNTKSITATDTTHNKHSSCLKINLSVPSIVSNQKGQGQTFHQYKVSGLSIHIKIAQILYHSKYLLKGVLNEHRHLIECIESKTGQKFSPFDRL